MNSVAITDHGCMFGVIDFYRAARAQGIKPILGCEVYVAPGSRFDKEAVGSGDDRYYHLVLLAENDEGYHNLMKIVSRGYTEGYYYKPRVDLELLREFHEGIIALSACLAGEVQKNITRGMYSEGRAAALRYEEIFGKGNFFLELQDHGIPEQQTVNQALMRMSQETGIELVATNDIHYTYAEDARAHDILLCIQTGKKLADEDRMRYEGGQYYIKSEEEMKKRITARTGYADENVLRFMISVVKKIHAYLKEEDLQDGVCGYRELENWVRTFQAIKDVRRAAQVAVISKATMDPEEQEHLMKTYVEPYC